MVFDTNLLIEPIRREQALPARCLISVVVAGELEAFAMKATWGYQKLSVMRAIFERFGVIEVNADLIPIYAQSDAYSQGKLSIKPLPPGISARNMGKNDLWIAATALYFGVELHTTDKDFDHLAPMGLRVNRG
jgi:predicted nucleic acid-binding protein